MTQPLMPPLTFPDQAKPVTVRTASGHQHKLLAGWHYVAHDTMAKFVPHLAGVTTAGYFLSVAVDHVESLEQQGSYELPAPAIAGRRVEDIPL